MTNPPATDSRPLSHRRLDWAIAAALVLVTLAAYCRVYRFEFVYFDDRGYVSENRWVRDGLKWSSVQWAFQPGDGEHQANWHPVTWLSHMLDVQLFGVESGPHHVVNMLFHTANAVLLFFLFRRMTGAVWRSAAVAALFALHPLHVESVAWVAERKDVLSAFFALVSLTAYVGYARRPGLWRYLLVAVPLALGLMAKPTVVTLPCVMLLLDYWPLGRVPPWRTWPWLLGEKLPLLALSALASLMTYLAQQRGGAVATSAGVPLFARLENALAVYVLYLGKMFWPVDLAMLYPLRWLGHLAAVAAGAFLVVVTLAVVWAAWRGRAYLAVGWFWYLGMLVPAIGIIHVGEQLMADRYTYLPLVGVFVMAAWGVTDLVGDRRGRRILAAAATATLVLACAALTFRQASYWANSETLFRHTLVVTRNNHVTHNNLANVLSWKGDAAADAGHPEEAVQCYQEAIQNYRDALNIRPGYAASRNNLGNTLSSLAAVEEQIGRNRSVAPGSPANAGRGRIQEAMQEYRTAIELDRNYADPRCNLANLLVKRVQQGISQDADGDLDEAGRQYGEALRLKPGFAQAYLGQGNVAFLRGNYDEAIQHYRDALKFDRDLAPARANLDAAIRAKSGRDKPSS